MTCANTMVGEIEGKWEMEEGLSFQRCGSIVHAVFRQRVIFWYGLRRRPELNHAIMETDGEGESFRCCCNTVERG